MTEELKKLDPIIKDKVNHEHRKFGQLESKFNESKYRWASVIEALVAQDYDVQAWYTDEELNSLLDWKSDYELAEAQKVAVAKERFNFNESLRAARKAKRTKAA